MQPVCCGKVVPLIEPPSYIFFETAVTKSPGFKHTSRAYHSRYLEFLRSFGNGMIRTKPDTMVVQKVGFALTNSIFDCS